MDHRVELLPAAGAQEELSRRDVGVRQRDGREPGPSVRHRERPALAEPRAAVLERIALRSEFLDALIRWDGLRDFLPDRAGVVEMDQMSRVRERLLGEVPEDLPLRPALADPTTGDFRGEIDAALRRGLGASASLLVSGLRGEQQDGLRGFDEHLAREDEILVDPEWNAFERGAHVLGFRERLEEVAARQIEDIEAPLVGRIDHPHGRHAGHRRRPESPELPESVRVLVVHREAEPVGRGLRPHLGAALDATVAADRHEAALLPSDDAPREAQIHDRLDVVHPEPVVGDAHAPDEDRGLGLMVHPREVEHPILRDARLPLELLPGLGQDFHADRVEARRVLLDEVLVDPAVFDEMPQHAIDECDVAARVDREELVREPRAEQRASGHGGNPVPFEPGLPHRIHDGDFRALPLRVVQILRRHRLIVRDVRTEEDDQVASDPIGVRTGGGRDPERFLQSRRAR